MAAPASELEDETVHAIAAVIEDAAHQQSFRQRAVWLLCVLRHDASHSLPRHASIVPGVFEPVRIDDKESVFVRQLVEFVFGACPRHAARPLFVYPQGLQVLVEKAHKATRHENDTLMKAVITCMRLWVHLKCLYQHTAFAALAHGTRNYPADTTQLGCLLG
jgi:hypothetical protein